MDATLICSRSSSGTLPYYPGVWQDFFDIYLYECLDTPDCNFTMRESYYWDLLLMLPARRVDNEALGVVQDCPD